MNERKTALEILNAIEAGGFCHICLNEGIVAHPELTAQERTFIRRLVRGCTERKLTLDYILASYAKNAEKLPVTVRNILRMSAYQICYLDGVPAFSVCDEAVKLTKKYRFPGLSGVVNGISRNLCRTKQPFQRAMEAAAKIDDITKRLEVLYSVDGEVISVLMDAYPMDIVYSILDACFQEPPLSIGINRSKTELSHLCTMLQADGVQTEPGFYLEDSLHLKSVGQMEQLQAYQKGLFRIQDESSMLVGLISGAKKGDRVLDLCAAPGGKSMHMADILAVLGGGTVVARDVTPEKVAKMNVNKERYGFTNVSCSVWDATKPRPEDTAAYDICIVDVPCSGLGVMARKPDIKYHVNEQQLSQLYMLQRQILQTAYAAVKIGGHLIFSTCTINPKENIVNLQYLLGMPGLSMCSFSNDLPPALRNEQTDAGYLQLLPGIHKTDGFFIAKLVKTNV